MPMIADPRTGKPVMVRDKYLSQPLHGRKSAAQSSREAQLQAVMWCQHPNLAPDREFTNANGVKVVANQCLTCGARVGGAKKRTPYRRYQAADTSLIGARDRAYAEYNKLRTEQLVEAIETQRREDGDWWAWYSNYLKSERWRLKRRAVWRRCKGVCEGCGEEPVVEVHHLTYEHVGNEFLFELVGLCLGCHGRLHRARDAKKQGYGSELPYDDYIPIGPREETGHGPKRP